MSTSVHNPLEPAEWGKSTYAQILKSSALIGGSSVVNIAIGIVRTKAMALLLGPAVIGLFGLYGSIANLTQSIAGMGINSSGVRQIAEAVGSEDAVRIAQTTVVLRRMSIPPRSIGSCFASCLFKTGAHVDSWQRSTRRLRQRSDCVVMPSSNL